MFSTISNYTEYKRFLIADAIAMGINPESRIDLLKSSFANPRWRFIKKLRKVEYYKNTSTNIFRRIFFLYLWYRYKKFALKLGFSIPMNVCAEGLSLPHYGTLVISKNAQIGKNARIHVDVNIGASESGAPVIGNNVYIGPGAKLFGKIVIGNNVTIGANAVVNKSFDQDNIVIAGVPAKIIKTNL
jgi:serine O-acetyltransferase